MARVGLDRYGPHYRTIFVHSPARGAEPGRHLFSAFRVVPVIGIGVEKAVLLVASWVGSGERWLNQARGRGNPLTAPNGAGVNLKTYSSSSPFRARPSARSPLDDRQELSQHPLPGELADLPRASSAARVTTSPSPLVALIDLDLSRFDVGFQQKVGVAI